jgi:hypothetical protein
MELVEQIPPPWRPPKQQETLILTLYEKPPDWSRFYVVRATYIGGGLTISPSLQCAVFRSEEEAVEWVKKCYPWMNFMGRAPDDQILGVWM